MIVDVRRVLRERGGTTIGVIAGETNADPAVVRAALDYWIHRGDVVECVPQTSGCGSCRLCGPAATAATHFYWQSPRGSML